MKKELILSLADTQTYVTTLDMRAKQLTADIEQGKVKSVGDARMQFLFRLAGAGAATTQLTVTPATKPSK